MSNPCAVTVPLSEIERIQVYVNTRGRTLTQIMRETGADYGINGTLYNMRSGEINCHLKADGVLLCDPGYKAWGYAWDRGEDLHLALLPASGEKSYIACTLLARGGKAESRLYYDSGQGGKRGRSAIGIKGDRLALYCSRDGSGAARTPEDLRSDLVKAGWDSAVMLDSGGSSQCDFQGQRITSSRRVQHYLLIYLKRDGCPYPEPTALVRQGSSGSGARWVQWQLQRHGGDLEVDGSFGAESNRTLRAFQQVFGLSVDGICGPATRAKLKAKREEKTVQAVLYAAASQVGITESPAGSNAVKYNEAFYGRKVSGSSYPWCVTFVWWVFRQAGFSLYKTASCTALVDRYREASPGQIIQQGYRPGDLVFFDFSGRRAKTEHVGIVESVAADGTLTTIEGNTGSGSNANGGAVMRRTRKPGLVTCGIRPGYSGE